MIDYHYQTFLVLADTLDYAKTFTRTLLVQTNNHAAYPISRSESEVKLFQNQGGNLTLTKKGQLLKNNLTID